jgi:hypothetical protein
MPFRCIVSVASVATFATEANATPHATLSPPLAGDTVPNGNCDNQETYESYWPTVSVQCTSADCEAPQYWVVADGNKKANVWTTNDPNDAHSAEGGFSWWEDYVTRELYDMNAGVVLEHKYSCNGAEQELTHWLNESQNVNTCKYAGGLWDRILTRLSPSSDWSYEQTIERGYSTTKSNSFSDTVSVSESAKVEFFEASITYSHVAQTTDSQTWSSKVTTKQTFSGPAGVSSVWWQYYLTCQGFNRQGLYVGKLQFATDIYKGTDSLTPPSENPPTSAFDVTV